MGCSSWDAGTYRTYSASTQSKSRNEVFQNSKLNATYDPKNITVRESVDSEVNPNSTAVIVGLDVTGSMGFIPEQLVKTQMGRLVEGLIESQAVSDPHIMMMAIGDIGCDKAPLQVSQFEADIKICDQLTEMWLEGGGGGNRFESYDLPWLFAAHKTKIDCFDKRQRKGYLFTVGDEFPPQLADPILLKDKLGIDVQQGTKLADVLEHVQERYHVFHLLAEEGACCRYHNRDLSVYKAWQELLGKRVICLDDHTFLPEVIQACIRVEEGEAPETILSEVGAARDTLFRALYGPNIQQYEKGM